MHDLKADFAYCRNCNGYIKPSRLKFCTDECREEFKHKKAASLESRHKHLIRVMDSERVPVHDALRRLGFYEGLVSQGCTYCGSLIESSASGIFLDRIVNQKNGKPMPHTADNCCPCCQLCNHVKGEAPPRGLSFEEMSEIRAGLIRISERRTARKG